MLPKKMIAAGVLEAAQMIEADGNSGIYAGRFPDSCFWVTRPAYKQWRDGILFYSSGHGWRVRRAPAWQEVYNLRFPEFKVEVENGSNKKA